MNYSSKLRFLFLGLLLVLPFYGQETVIQGPPQIPIFAGSLTLNDSLISYWRLDEASGTRVDSEPTGTPQNLTDNNTVTAKHGILGVAGQFTAANNEYLSAADSADLSLGDIDFTVSAWVYMDTKPSETYILGKGSTVPVEYYLRYMGGGTDRFEWHVNGSANAVANNFGSPPLGRWMLIVCWHDAAANLIGISVDGGTADTSSFGGGSTDTTEAFNIGTTDALTGFDWNGRIDEVGFWKRKLSTSEITELYNLHKGKTCCAFDGAFASLNDNLVAYWRLNESSGTRNDSAGSNNLTDNNTVTTGWGKVGLSADFVPGNSEYLSITDNAALSMGDIDFTIAGWCLLDDKTAVRSVVAKWTTAGNRREYYLIYNNSPDRFQFAVSSNGTAATTINAALGSPSTGVWYFIAAFHDSVNNLIGITATAASSTAPTDFNTSAYSSGVTDDISAFQIGRFDTTPYFDGRIDEIGIWKRKLSHADLTMLFNQGMAKQYRASGGFSQNPNDLERKVTCHWTLDEASGTRNDNDKAGTARNLTDNNTCGARTSKIGANAADFISTNSEYLSVTDNTDLDCSGNTTFSFALWLNQDIEGADRWPLTKWNSGTNNREYLLRYLNSADKWQFLVSADGTATTGVQCDTFGTVTTGTWYFVAFGHDATADIIWISVNGGPKDTTAHSTGIFNSSAAFELGGLSSSSLFYDGAIDDVYFFRGYTLTDDDIDELYQSDGGLTCCEMP